MNKGAALAHDLIFIVRLRSFVSFSRGLSPGKSEERRSNTKLLGFCVAFCVVKDLRYSGVRWRT